MYKLRTLDVWDTLLRRKSHPDNSKLASARALTLLLSNQLMPEFQDHHRIFHERCTIEGEYSRRAGDGEYSLFNVTTDLIARIIHDENSVNISKVVKDIIKFEIEFEKRNTYSDPHIVEFIKEYPAEKTIFLSDFYMPATDLRHILEHHGLNTIVDGGISSCDIALNKRSGHLFEYIHTQFDILPTEHVHIGDNLHADVNMPKSLGLNGIHFLPQDEHTKRQNCAKLFSDREILFKSISDNTQHQAKTLIKTLNLHQQAAYNLGLRSAPLIIGFILYVAEQSLKNKVEKIYFFTREGEFFIKVWKALFPDGTLAGQILPETGILEVSRLATFCASLQEVSTSEMMRVWNLYSTQSIYSLFKTLGIDPEKCRSLCQKYNINLENEIVYPWQDKRVQDLFMDENFKNIIQKAINENKKLLLQYLNEKGCTENTHCIGIVDIGWRGTIQDNIAYVIPKTKIFGYYMGLQYFLNKQPENCIKSSFGPDANKSQSNTDLLDAVSLLEMLCNAPSGSVLNYKKDTNGKIISNRLVDDEENDVFYKFVSFFQESVLFSSSLWANEIDTHVISSQDLYDYACIIWKNLVHNTDTNLLNAYHALNHNEIFGVGKFVKKNNVPSMKNILSGIFVKVEREKIIKFIKQNQLITSFSRRKDLNTLHKFTIIFIIWFALQYKHVRNYLKIINKNILKK